MTCTATFYDITCNRNTPYVGISGHYHRHVRTDNEPYYAEWGDDTPGATPHVEPVPAVTDAELTAAMYAWMDAGGSRDRRWSKALSQFRAALAAAFAVRDKEQTEDLQ